MDEKTILSSVLTFYIGSCEQVIKICVIHITILEKKGKPGGETNHFHSVLPSSVKTHQSLCVSVSDHLLFRGTNTDDEVSLDV